LWQQVLQPSESTATPPGLASTGVPGTG
jgi:hypothetical protein